MPVIAVNEFDKRRWEWKCRGENYSMRCWGYFETEELARDNAKSAMEELGVKDWEIEVKRRNN